jgi:all-trans-retinol 13,14-reductase
VTAGVGGALVGGMLTTGAMVGVREFGKVQKMLKEWQPPQAEPAPRPA